MEDIEIFIKKYDIKRIKEIEHQDPQFISLQTCRDKIENKNENLFLFLVIQSSMVSYQLSWTWEKRWKEVWIAIERDWNILLNLRNNNEKNTLRWYNFLKWSKNNKRLINMKKFRIEKTYNIISLNKNLSWYSKNLNELNIVFSKSMNSKINAKTIVFAIKMYWYAFSIITKKEINYPLSINIPIDSRLKKIYYTMVDKKPWKDNKSWVTKYRNWYYKSSKT